MEVKHRSLFVALVVVASVPGACRNPTGPASPAASSALTERIETAHFTFEFALGDRVNPVWQEAFHDWATNSLGVTPSRKILYRKYRSREHMAEVTGTVGTNAYADGPGFTVHTTATVDNHEVVHLYSYVWGMPVAMFTEGLAVAYSMNPVGSDLVARWGDAPVDDVVRQLRAAGTLPPLTAIATTRGFRQFDPGTSYPVAGSFVRFLIDTRGGLAPVKLIYRTISSEDNFGAVEDAVRTAYGLSLEELETLWLRQLG